MVRSIPAFFKFKSLFLLKTTEMVFFNELAEGGGVEENGLIIRKSPIFNGEYFVVIKLV